MEPRTADLWGAIEYLTEHQRRVVFEMYWHGYSREECAETMGVSHQAISETLAKAGARVEKKVGMRLAKAKRRPLIPLDEENGGAESSNGQSPDTQQASASGPAPSLSPQPDKYYETPERDAFVKELSWCAASPFLQLQNRGGYNARARANRDRIARDLAAERAERRALQAA